MAKYRVSNPWKAQIVGDLIQSGISFVSAIEIIDEDLAKKSPKEIGWFFKGKWFLQQYLANHELPVLVPHEVPNIHIR